MPRCLLLLALQVTIATAANIKGPPVAQEKEVSRIVRVGEEVKVVCPITGYPEPLIEWRKGLETIDYSWIRIRTNNKAMRIKKAQEDDTGVYICKGVNGFGNTEVRVDLIVIDPSKFPDLKDGELPDISAPSFTKATEEAKSYYRKAEGDSFRVTCEAKGNPQPDIFWYKDGLPFDADGIRYRNGKSTLKLKNLMKVDSAVYTCQASNLVGSAGRNYTLAVEAMEAEQPTISGAGNQTIPEGGTVSLQCRVKSSAPPHIKWLKKMSPGAPQDAFTINVGNDRYTVIHTGEDVAIGMDGYLNKLTIYNVKEHDSGLYICFVTNSAGSFNYKPSYLTVYKGSSVERGEAFPGAGESTSILVLVISLGIIVVLILIFIIVCVVRKNSKAAAHPDSPEVVRTLMGGTQSSSTITTVASKHFDQPLPPPPSMWATSGNPYCRDFASLHENSSTNLLSDRESPVSLGGNTYEVPFHYGKVAEARHYAVHPVPTTPHHSTGTGLSEHTGYPFRHYPYFQYLNDYDSY